MKRSRGYGSWTETDHAAGRVAFSNPITPITAVDIGIVNEPSVLATAVKLRVVEVVASNCTDDVDRVTPAAEASTPIAMAPVGGAMATVTEKVVSSPRYRYNGPPKVIGYKEANRTTKAGIVKMKYSEVAVPEVVKLRWTVRGDVRGLMVKVTDLEVVGID